MQFASACACRKWDFMKLVCILSRFINKSTEKGEAKMGECVQFSCADIDVGRTSELKGWVNQISLNALISLAGWSMRIAVFSIVRVDKLCGWYYSWITLDWPINYNLTSRQSMACWLLLLNPCCCVDCGELFTFFILGFWLQNKH